MKEIDARKKWCPHVRIMSDEDSHVIATVNRGGELQADNNCIASDCMMWIEETATNCHTGESSVCGGHCGLIK